MHKYYHTGLILILILVLALSGCRGGIVGGSRIIRPGQQSPPYTVGGVTFCMRYVPKGSFTSDNNTINGTIDVFPTMVTVPNTYWIAETVVTYELWYAVKTWAISNGYQFTSGNNAGMEGSLGTVGAIPTANKQHPVTSVNWRDAIVWCNALSEMVGLLPVYKKVGVVVKDSNSTDCDVVFDPVAGDKGFRLPTSNEWDLAARYIGGTKFYPGLYASGADVQYTITDPIEVTADYDGDGDKEITSDVAVYDRSSTAVVKSKSSNKLGLYDMSGNVWQWCFDWHPNYAGSYRIWRGGSWNDVAGTMQLGIVNRGVSYNSGWNLGFRLVRTQ